MCVRLSGCVLVYMCACEYVPECVCVCVWVVMEISNLQNIAIQ